MLTGKTRKLENQTTVDSSKTKGMGTTDELSEKNTQPSFAQNLMRTMQPSGVPSIQMKEDKTKEALKEKPSKISNDKPISDDKLRKGVYGTDGEPIKIVKDGEGYIISGNPDPDTKQIFEALLKTPAGVENAIEYTTSAVEFRFKLVDKVYDQDEQVHAATYEADENNDNIADSKKPFHHYNVEISIAVLPGEDRMNSWTDDMRLHVIASHEKGHVDKRGFSQDADHTEGTSFTTELIAAFQYNILYQNNSAINEPWLHNYNNNQLIGHKMVNKLYKKAVLGLINAGKITQEVGDKMILEFTAANVSN